MNFAFLFPGQGSQSIGMLKELASECKEIRETFDEASDILSKDLWKLVERGPEEKLNLTENAQPVMLVASIAMFRIWNNLSDQLPVWQAGHSLGEYSALVCAGSITFKDAIKLVQMRAKIMQEAVPPGVGAMIAVLGIEKKPLSKLCAKIDGVVETVNFNSPKQVVVAGHKESVEALMKQLTQVDGCKTILLPVSVPSHSSLMKTAAQKFADYLADIKFQTPQVPVLHNIDATIKENPEKIKQALVKQLYSPVQWMETIANISGEGVEHFVEMGPGRVLSGILKRIDKSFNIFNLNNLSAFEKALAAIDD